MFNFLPFFIGFRYTRAKKRNGFISFISAVSMAGIALGVAILITVLSVMNGFDYEIHKRIFSMSNQVTITDESGSMVDWQLASTKAKTIKHVVNASPFIEAQGMLANSGVVQGVFINGIIPDYEKKISAIPNNMVEGSLNNLQAGSFNIILGEELATRLGVGVGDKVTLFIPAATVTPLGVIPRFKRFTVMGTFSVGGGFGYDEGYAFINMFDAQKLLQMQNGVTGVHLKVDDLYIAPKVAYDLRQILPRRFGVTDWTTQYATYFDAIKMEKTMMFVILMFIIAVATFNLVSSLVMTVTDKNADIAILRTLGASPKTIMQIFIVQGSVVGFFGTIIGVVGGVLLALNAPELVRIIEHLFHTKFISSSVYFIDYLPSKLDWHYVVNVSIASLIMSLVATVYPAWRAAKVHPAEALRYE
jgi:lipoprotein-releasing system permease protein